MNYEFMYAYEKSITLSAMTQKYSVRYVYIYSIEFYRNWTKEVFKISQVLIYATINVRLPS